MGQQEIIAGPIQHNSTKACFFAACYVILYLAKLRYLARVNVVSLVKDRCCVVGGVPQLALVLIFSLQK